MKTRPAWRGLRAAMLAVNQGALLATLVVLAWQRNWPLELPGFDPAGVPFMHILPTARLAELTALAAVGAYALAGWPNRERLLRGERRMFTLSLLALLGLAALSPLWAMHRGLAAVHAGHMTAWTAFALMMASGDWPARRLAAFLLAGLLIHAAVGYLQVALQHFVGLGPRFGEVPVRPEETWASVVFAGPVRLLRAYGLSGHPNVLGGHLAVGLILSYGLLVAWPRVWRALIAVAWVLVWVLLLVTFSRSAWLALIAGALVAAALLWRARLVGRWATRSALTLGGLAVVAGIIFVAAFQPFLINRAQPAAQPFEAFSVEQREEMIDVAVQLIAARPLTGAGAANFSTASQTVTWQGYALDWAHNVPLLVTSELGLLGLAACLALLGSIVAAGARRWRSRSITLWQALIGGGLAALLTIMLFDHYLWTAPQGGLLWALLAGVWLANPAPNVDG